MAYTLSFSEKNKGWVSFKSFHHENGISLNNSYYTFSGGGMYQHHVNEARNEFYGVQFDSSVDILFNQGPGIIKSFSTLNYEGSQARVTPEINDNPDYYDNFPKNGWYVKEMISNAQELGVMEFWDKEDKWFSQIKGVKTEWLNDGTAGNIDPQEFSYQGIGNAYDISCPTCPSVVTWNCETTTNIGNFTDNCSGKIVSGVIGSSWDMVNWFADPTRWNYNFSDYKYEEEWAYNINMTNVSNQCWTDNLSTNQAGGYNAWGELIQVKISIPTNTLGIPVGDTFYNTWAALLTFTQTFAPNAVTWSEIDNVMMNLGLSGGNYIQGQPCSCTGVVGSTSSECIEINGPGGEFANEYDCENCVNCPCNTPSISFDCYNGVCSDPGTGNGIYSTYCDCVNGSLCCDEGAAYAFVCQNISLATSVIVGCMDGGPPQSDPFITQQRPNGWIGSATNHDPSANVHDCSCIYVNPTPSWDCITTPGIPDTYQYNNCDDPTLITVSPNGELDFNGNPQYDMWTVWSHALTIFSDPTYNLQNTNFEQVLFCVDNTYGACTTNDCCPCNNGLGHLQGIIEIVYDYDLFTGTNVWPSITPGVYGNLTMGAGLPQNYSSLVSNWQQFDPSITLGMTFLEIGNSLNAVANANPSVSTGNAYRRDTLGRVCQCNGLIPGTPGSTDCEDPGTGLGLYPTLLACQNNCTAATPNPSWDCGSAGCYDPGTGNGQYNTLSACQTGCTAISESWDCVSGSCVDPGTGNGQYATLSACQSDPLSNCCIPSLIMNSQCTDNYNQWISQGSNVYGITGTYYPGRVVSFIDPAVGIVNYFIASAASGTQLGASSSTPQLYPEPTAANLWAPFPGNDKGSWEGCEVAPCGPPQSGCTDPLAYNYDPLATIDDGSCCYIAGEFVLETRDESEPGAFDGRARVVYTATGALAPSNLAYAWSNGMTTSEVIGLGVGPIGVTVTDICQNTVLTATHFLMANLVPGCTDPGSLSYSYSYNSDCANNAMGWSSYAAAGTYGDTSCC